MKVEVFLMFLKKLKFKKSIEDLLYTFKFKE